MLKVNSNLSHYEVVFCKCVYVFCTPDCKPLNAIFTTISFQKEEDTIEKEEKHQIEEHDVSTYKNRVDKLEKLIKVSIVSLLSTHKPHVMPPPRVFLVYRVKCK